MKAAQASKIIQENYALGGEPWDLDLAKRREIELLTRFLVDLNKREDLQEAPTTAGVILESIKYINGSRISK